MPSLQLVAQASQENEMGELQRKRVKLIGKLCCVDAAARYYCDICFFCWTAGHGFVVKLGRKSTGQQLRGCCVVVPD